MLDLATFDFISLIKRLSDERIRESHTLHGIIAVHLHELDIEFTTKNISEIIEMLVSINYVKVKKYSNGHVDYDTWKLKITKTGI